jgi:predicted DNA-binding protein
MIFIASQKDIVRYEERMMERQQQEKKTLTIRIDNDLYEKLQRVAQDQEQTEEEIVEWALEAHIRVWEPPDI